MIIQDWERERNMEDTYIFEKQFEKEYKYFNKFNVKSGKIKNRSKAFTKNTNLYGQSNLHSIQKRK